MKSIIILLLCIFICLISGETSTESTLEIQKKRFDNFTLAYLCQYGMYQLYGTLNEVNGNISLTFNRNITEIDERFMELCIYRTSFDQIFFISPYLVMKNGSSEFDDAIILCLIDSNFESIGIFDEYVLFDALLLKRFESVPVSITDPIVNAEKGNGTNCYDFYGLPSKDVLGQQTCLLSVDMSHEKSNIYSGPLMGNEMTFDTMGFCYTSVNVTMKGDDADKCYFLNSVGGIKFQCCCFQTPELCSPRSLAIINEQKRFCLPGLYRKESKNNFWITIKASKDRYINYACSSYVSLHNRGNESYDLNITYGAIDKCVNETTYLVNRKTGFCSSNLSFPEEVEMWKCCNDEHFCNQKFIPQELSSLEAEYRCKHKPFHAFYVSETPKCEFFFDIWKNGGVFILLNFNAKVSEGQRSYTIINITTTYGVYEYNYIYYKIIKADSPKCEHRIYTSKYVNEYRPFIHALCETDTSSSEPCDTAYEIFGQKEFECETLNEILFDESKTNYLTTMDKVDGWICYVEIYSDSSDKNYVYAGELTDFYDREACLQNDMNDGTFCCSHVFDTPQNETECTVEKLIAERNLRKNDPSKNVVGTFSNCIIKDLPIDKCLSESGCFETRLLKYSQHSDANEPAGCIDNTEKNIIENISMASLSLGCRVDENSNRCSVVQTPEGEQRIVCCCNGKECESNFSKLPKQIGRNVSSFKE